MHATCFFIPASSHYDEVTMGAIASQITSLTIVYSTVYSGVDQSKHQSSASLAFVYAPHKWPVTRKMFPFDDVIMWLGIVAWIRATIKLISQHKPSGVIMHYSDVIMGAMAYQITSVWSVYSTVCSVVDQRKHESSESLAFVGEFGDQWIPLTKGQ